MEIQYTDENDNIPDNFDCYKVTDISIEKKKQEILRTARKMIDKFDKNQIKYFVKLKDMKYSEELYKRDKKRLLEISGNKTLFD